MKPWKFCVIHEEKGQNRRPESALTGYNAHSYANNK